VLVMFLEVLENGFLSSCFEILFCLIVEKWRTHLSDFGGFLRDHYDGKMAKFYIFMKNFDFF